MDMTSDLVLAGPAVGSPFIRITGDGNCLFRALATRLMKSEDFHQFVRRLIVNYVHDHWSPYYSLLSGMNDKDEYLQCMSRVGEYGTVAEIWAAGEIFHRTVAIVRDGELVSCSLNPNDSDPIVLRISGEGREAHYDVYESVPAGIALDALKDEPLLGGPAPTAAAPEDTTPSPAERKRQRDRERRERIRADPAALERKRQGDRERKQRHRADPEAVERLRQRDRERKRLDKADPAALERKRQRDRERKRRDKADPAALERKRRLDRERKRRDKADPAALERKRRGDRERKRLTRADPEAVERKRRGDRERKRLSRADPEALERVRQRDRERKRREKAAALERERKQCGDHQARKKACVAEHCDEDDKTMVMDEGMREASPICYEEGEYSLSEDDSIVSEPSDDELDVEDDASTAACPGPNDPCVVARVKSEVEAVLAGVAASQCFVCDRIINTRKVKVFEPSESRMSKSVIKQEEEVDPDPSAVVALLDQLVVQPGRFEMCGSCNNSVLQGKVPVLAVANGFKYPPRPPHLPDLTEVAEHILAARTPFKQITTLGRVGRVGQYGLRGSVISVPADPGMTPKSNIPHLPDEDQLCIVNIKRKMAHKRHFASGHVDRRSLSAWASFLADTELYEKYGVMFDETKRIQEDEWLDDAELDAGVDVDEFVTDQIQYSVLMPDLLQAEPPKPTAASEPVAVDPLADDMDVAPVEVRQPMPVVCDRLAEELSFPSVYLGQPRRFTRPVTRFHAMKSEVRRVDRRGAKPIPLLYKYTQHYREQVSRFKREAEEHWGCAVTKDQLCDPTFIASSQRQCFAMPSLMSNSTQYWETTSHVVFTMVRQLGRPTLLLTLSAAEYHWPLLLKTLQRLSGQHGQGVKDEELGPVSPQVQQAAEELVQEAATGNPINIPEDERLKLIRDDPVACTMYFREVVLLLRKYLAEKRGPMGKYWIVDYFFRIEFQAVDSPHVHCLLWLRNAPADPLKDLEAAAQLADELISCSSKHPLADRVKHKHTATCFRSSRVVQQFLKRELDPSEAHRSCRFGVPFWPSPRTRIVLPLSEDRDERSKATDKPWSEYLKHLEALRLRMKDVLMSEDCPATLEGLWQAVGCEDEETYLLAIRSGIIRPTVLYRREMEDIWTNPHLPWVLEVFGSKTDAQLVTDVYSLVRYCVSYITKGEKTCSELHKQILSLRKDGGFDDREIMRLISTDALQAKETSAQEAAWVLQQFPLCETSRQCLFVNTCPANQRMRCVKSEKLSGSSTERWWPDIFDSYAAREDDLEHVSLAVFAARYHKSMRTDAAGKNIGRVRNRIVRHRRYRASKDDQQERENYFRVLCTLHVPWRDESVDILKAGPDGTNCGPFEGLFLRHKDLILAGRRQFEFTLDLQDEVDEELGRCLWEDEEEAAMEVEALASRGHSRPSFYEFDDLNVAEFMDATGRDAGLDLPGGASSRSSVPVVAGRRRGQWDRDTFIRNIRQLNPQQKAVVLVIIDGIRLRSKPRLIYIDGAAGTGKSLVARCVINALETFAPNRFPGYPKSAVAAPTDKAAGHIGGKTVHSVYGLSLTEEAGAARRAQEGAEQILTHLLPERLARLRDEFRDVFGQVIDEVNMISQSCFISMHERCMTATRKREPFGGLWTFVFGDFRQLPPVGRQYLYETSEKAVADATVLWHQFEYAELTQNMRQADDKVFADILRKIGDYEQLTDKERSLIESRFVRQNQLAVPNDAPRLYFTNSDVVKYNRQQILKNPLEKIFISEAVDRFGPKSPYKGKLTKAYRKQREEKSSKALLVCASKVKLKPARGLPYSLVIMADYPYMLTVNADTADGLVNGAVGTLVWVELDRARTSNTTEQDGCQEPDDVDDDDGGEVTVSRLWLRFPSRVGRELSKQYRAELRAAVARAPRFANALLPFQPPPPPTEKEMEGLVPFFRERAVLNNVRTEHWRQIIRQQFSFVTGMAFTIHQSQGSTYSSVCTEYSPTQSNPLVYVGLSRVTSLSGLYISGPEPPPGGRLFQHPPVLGIQEGEHVPPKKRLRKEAQLDERRRYLDEKERLRAKQLVPRWQPILDTLPELLRLVYHNVQSLNAHQEDVRLDEVFMGASLLLLAETWLQPGDSVSLGGDWLEAARCDRAAGRRGGGAAIYSKLKARQLPQPAHPDIEMCAVLHEDWLRVAVMYCHGKLSADSVVQAVRALLPPDDNYKTVLCGDFGLDMRPGACPQGKQLVEGLAALGLSMKNSDQEATTYDESGAVVDGLFSDISHMQVERYQSYFSQHLPLFASLS